jgi:hypothetical protein
MVKSNLKKHFKEFYHGTYQVGAGSPNQLLGRVLMEN